MIVCEFSVGNSRSAPVPQDFAVIHRCVVDPTILNKWSARLRRDPGGFTLRLRERLSEYFKTQNLWASSLDPVPEPADLDRGKQSEGNAAFKGATHSPRP